MTTRAVSIRFNTADIGVGKVADGGERPRGTNGAGMGILTPAERKIL